MLRLHVVLLTDIIAQVKELDARCARRFLSGPWIAPATGTWREAELPIPLPHAECTGDAVMDNRFAQRLICLALERGKKTHAVFRGIVRKLDAEHISASGHEIEKAHRVSVAAACLHHRGPLCDKGDVVSAIVDVRLVATEITARIVSFRQEGRKIGAR